MPHFRKGKPRHSNLLRNGELEAGESDSDGFPFDHLDVFVATLLESFAIPETLVVRLIS